MEAYNNTEQTMSSTLTSINGDFEVYVYSWAVVFYRFLVSAIGIPGNIIILLVYKRRKSLGSAQVFINALALSDLYVCLIAPFSIYYFIYEQNYTSAILCKIGTTSESFGWYTSASLTIAVAAERYVAICKPLTRRWSRRKTLIVCGCCVFLALVAILPEAYGATSTVKVHPYFGYSYYGCAPHGDDKRFVFIVALPRFISPLVALPLLVVIYIKIWRKVRKQNRAIAVSMKANALSENVVRPQPHDGDCLTVCKSGSSGDRTDDKLTGERGGNTKTNPNPDPAGNTTKRTRNSMSKLTRMLLLTTLFFATTWLLSIFLFSFKSQTDAVLYPNSIAFIVVSVVRLCPLLNHAINPFIYSYTNNQFRRECRQLLCCQQ